MVLPFQVVGLNGFAGMIAFVIHRVRCPSSSSGKRFSVWLAGSRLDLHAGNPGDTWWMATAAWLVVWGSFRLPCHAGLYSLGFIERHSLLIPGLAGSAVSSFDTGYSEFLCGQAVCWWSRWSWSLCGTLRAGLTGRFKDTTANGPWKRWCLPGGTRSSPRTSIWQRWSCIYWGPFPPRSDNGRDVPRVHYSFYLANWRWDQRRQQSLFQPWTFDYRTIAQSVLPHGRSFKKKIAYVEIQYMKQRGEDVEKPLKSCFIFIGLAWVHQWGQADGVPAPLPKSFLLEALQRIPQMACRGTWNWGVWDPSGPLSINVVPSMVEKD